MFPFLLFLKNLPKNIFRGIFFPNFYFFGNFTPITPQKQAKFIESTPFSRIFEDNFFRKIIFSENTMFHHFSFILSGAKMFSVWLSVVSSAISSFSTTYTTVKIFTIDLWENKIWQKINWKKSFFFPFEFPSFSLFRVKKQKKGRKFKWK